MKYPPSFIERLRNHFLISEVIGKRIAIKKHGREYQALCPFHNEKTPSFTMNDEKGFFHCFGCGAHGDAIEFIKRYERLTYPETIERLARDAGIPLPVLSPEERKKAEAEKTLYDVLEAACEWFERQLQSPPGASAYGYIEKRGLKPETVRLFRIGYAPEERTALYNHLLSLGFKQPLQAEAGLIIVPDSGAPYDRFRGRVMFPIRNASGKIVAFGGRLLANSVDTKHLPKYLNSPETALFKKGEMLFNLDLAKRPAREGGMVVVMEGYMDVVMSYQAGIHYGVATLGTAVTPEHLRLLWQLSKEPVICLDGDSAGKRAMLRAAEVALPLLKPGHSLRFAMLPPGEDPDTFVQKHGKAALEKLLTGARHLSQIAWDILAAKFRTDLPEGRAALEDNCRQLAAKITDPTVRQHYLSHFKKQLWTKTRATAETPRERSAHVEHMVVQHHSGALETLTRRMIKTLLQFPQLLHKSHVEESLSRLSIANPSLDALRNVILASIAHTDLNHQEEFLRHIQNQLPGDLLTSMLNDKLHLPYRDTLTGDDALMLWNETVSAYEVTHLESELKSLERQLAETMDESIFNRLIQIKQSLNEAQAGRTFSTAPSDVL